MAQKRNVKVRTDEDRYNAMKEYMEKEFGVTPENIDEKLEELRIEFQRKIDRNKKAREKGIFI